MKPKSVQVPDGFTQTFTAVDGHEVHALTSNTENSAEQMVMIHGALASRRYLMPTALLLGRFIHVFVPEMPGHGASSKPGHALSVEQQAEVMHEWFRANRLKRSHFFANSYGCQVAAQLVATHPEIAKTLTLTSPTNDPRARTLIQQAYRFYLNGMGEPKGAPSQLLDDLSDMGLVIAFETVERMMHDDIIPKLTKIKCPTLVVRGERDPIAPEAWTEEIVRCLPNAHFNIIPNAPHCVNYATAPELTSIILQFIKEVEPEAA